MKDVLMNNAGAGALGGLTGEEVEDIFNALKVNKADTTIRWHGFIAAGLSQCKVDDRNLQLAFDRLDADRKGFVTFKDLADLLGHSPETLESIKKMWEESMQQCSCRLGRISYDDFLLLMKGQTRRETSRPSLVWSPKSVLLSTEDRADLEFPKDGTTNASIHGKKENGFLRQRSKSFDTVTLESDISSADGSEIRRTSLPANLASAAADSDLVRRLAMNEGKVPLLATREQYKKHRDLRLAVLEASKVFDTKRRSHCAVEAGEEAVVSPLVKAGLIMKRGSIAPQNIESQHQRVLFDAAVRRGGGRYADGANVKLPRHRKKRTQSDITGMLLEPCGN